RTSDDCHVFVRRDKFWIGRCSLGGRVVRVKRILGFLQTAKLIPGLGKLRIYLYSLLQLLFSLVPFGFYIFGAGFFESLRGVLRRTRCRAAHRAALRIFLSG